MRVHLPAHRRRRDRSAARRQRDELRLSTSNSREPRRLSVRAARTRTPAQFFEMATAMNTATYRAVQDLPAFNRRDAAWLADRFIDDTIQALQRDLALPSRSFADWSLALADRRLRLSEQLANKMIGRVDLDEVLVTLEAVL